MEEVMSFVSEVGFPILVTMYRLLHRIETKLEAVIASIRLLPQEMKNQ
ncbi:YvrJ family protein [Bacillus salacetis]